MILRKLWCNYCMEKYKSPFDATLEMSELVISISDKIGKINSFSDLSKDPILGKANRVKSIYSSCAIEANSLSFEQVSELINGKKVIGPQKDIFEIKMPLKLIIILSQLILLMKMI